ncbi:hypothetical protein [Nannocystis pusilla]|uniref:hypothetical protein n=1 Tax=Nannocystis pusilla TaxID=889268 RepID=UPI003B7EBB10
MAAEPAVAVLAQAGDALGGDEAQLADDRAGVGSLEQGDARLERGGLLPRRAERGSCIDRTPSRSPNSPSEPATEAMKRRWLSCQQMLLAKL